MNTQEQNQQEQQETVVQAPPPPKKKVSKKRKIEYDENGNPIKKVRQTNKVKYPEVKIQPRTAYMLFSTEMAAKAREEAEKNPDAKKIGTKKISELWNATSKEDRKKWIDMAAADKKRYFDEVRSHGYEIKEKNKQPSRPCSAFLLYAKAKQKEYREIHNTTYEETLKALGVRWKDPNFEEERKPFIEEAARRKEEWNKNNPKE